MENTKIKFHEKIFNNISEVLYPVKTTGEDHSTLNIFAMFLSKNNIVYREWCVVSKPLIVFVYDKLDLMQTDPYVNSLIFKIS